MSDIAVTAANVTKVSGQSTSGIAGAAITAGQSIFVDDTDSNKIKLTDVDAANTGRCDGIALNNAATGQPVIFAQAGAEVDLGTDAAVGEIYVGSSTAGGIAPHADLGSGKRVAIVGWGNAAGNIVIMGTNTGVNKA